MIIYSFRFALAPQQTPVLHAPHAKLLSRLSLFCSIVKGFFNTNTIYNGVAARWRGKCHYSWASKGLGYLFSWCLGRCVVKGVQNLSRESGNYSATSWEQRGQPSNSWASLWTGILPNFKWKLLKVHHHDLPVKVFNILHSLRQNSSFSFRQKQHQSTRNQTKNSFETEAQRACKHLSSTFYCQTERTRQWHFILFLTQDVHLKPLYAELPCWYENWGCGCPVETAPSQVLLCVMHWTRTPQTGQTILPL